MNSNASSSRWTLLVLWDWKQLSLLKNSKEKEDNRREKPAMRRHFTFVYKYTEMMVDVTEEMKAQETM